VGDLLVIMAEFILKITLGNDAMNNPEDIGKELIRIGKVLEQPEMSSLEKLYCRCGIRDINGNFVGYYGIE
jgi:hypothetical protein